MKWKNPQACKNEAYVPTLVEHVANVITHGIWIVPALLGALELIDRASSWSRLLSAIVYGVSLLLLFTVSTVFHSIHYCSLHHHDDHKMRFVNRQTTIVMK